MGGTPCSNLLSNCIRCLQGAHETIFTDRHDAGRRLGEALRLLELDRPVALGIPRGGVVVAAEAARAIGAELDVVLVRKLRHPHQPELAIGAIGEDGHACLNEETARGVPEEAIFQEERQRLEELREKTRLYRAARPPVDISGRQVVLIDDGVATGSTMEAAARLTRSRNPARLIIGLPVAASFAVETLRRTADEVVCVHTPASLRSVGQFYHTFTETTDEDVVNALRDSLK